MADLSGDCAGMALRNGLIMMRFRINTKTTKENSCTSRVSLMLISAILLIISI